MWRRIGRLAPPLAAQLPRGQPRWCSDTAWRKSCADQLEQAARQPDELCTILQQLPKECRETFAAEVIRANLKENALESVVNRLSNSDVRALGVLAVSRHFGQDFQKEFKALDEDKSGTICHAEFKRYLTTVMPEHHQADATAPTRRQLLLFALNSAIPFVVFGFLDNSIMIVGGDVVDDMIGSTFQLSTLACAALANTFADVFGISIGNTVEALTGRLGVPQANLTAGQSRLPYVRRVGLVAGSVGILTGCLLGMTPLLFTDEEKREEKKALRDLFQKIDSDKSGFVELEELVRALRVVGVAGSEEQAAKVIKALDLDHDGKVTSEELQKNFSRLKTLLSENS